MVEILLSTRIAVGYVFEKYGPAFPVNVSRFSTFSRNGGSPVVVTSKLRKQMANLIVPHSIPITVLGVLKHSRSHSHGNSLY